MRVITVLALFVLFAGPAAAQYSARSTAADLGAAGTVPGSGASQHMKDILHNREAATTDKYDKVGAYAKRSKNTLPPTPQP